MTRVFIPDEDAAFPSGYVFRTHAPELAAAALNLSRAVYEHTKLSLREMEAARLRTAQINGCNMCKQARAARDFDTEMQGSGIPFERPMHTRGDVPDEAFYAAIANWRDAPLFSDRERLAIEFAERMGERPQSFEGDELFWSRLHTHFSDRELTDLALCVGSWMGMGRFMHIFELDTVCLSAPAAEPVL